MLAKNIYNRTRVKNNEILELLIYGAYIEEQSKLNKNEKQIMKDDINYYYQEGQKEVLRTQKRNKPISIIDMALFLYLLEQTNLEQYIQMTIQYNAQQMYKQTLINIQQQKELEIENDEFQRIINQQQNTKLCINNEKISGFMDNQLIGLNNKAKVEGIKEIDNNGKVKFIAVTDGNETDMCHSLDGQIFYINKENVFNRYYGETQKELRIQEIKCNGLILGLNLPPISHHFHWCRSTITYLVEDYKKYFLEYRDITSSILNQRKRKYKVEEQQYFIDDNGNKYIVDGKNVIMKHTNKEKEVAKILSEIYRRKVKLIPAVLNPQHIKTPDYMIKNVRFDLKEPTGNSKTTIYDLFKHKSKQADNFIIDIHKSELSRLESIEQTQQLFYSSHRKWINTIILMEDNEIFKILKRK